MAVIELTRLSELQKEKRELQKTIKNGDFKGKDRRFAQSWLAEIQDKISALKNPNKKIFSFK